MSELLPIEPRKQPTGTLDGLRSWNPIPRTHSSRNGWSETALRCERASERAGESGSARGACAVGAADQGPRLRLVCRQVLHPSGRHHPPRCFPPLRASRQTRANGRETATRHRPAQLASPRARAPSACTLLFTPLPSPPLHARHACASSAVCAGRFCSL